MKLVGKLLFLLFQPLTVLILTAFSFQFGGYWLATGLLFVFIVHPLLDFLLYKFGIRAKDRTQVSHFYFYSSVLGVFIYFFYALNLARQLTWGYEFILLTLSTGSLMGALGITMGHELVHRASQWQRAFGLGLLSLCFYSHFRIEHVYGHHTYVGTKDDPASAQAGDSIYAFWINSFFGGFLSAMRIETERVSSISSSLKKILSNRVFHYLIIYSLMTTWLLSFSLLLFVFWILQGIVAILLLESVNYIEHYGLRRNLLPNGRFEPVSDRHSWDNDWPLTNSVLINLGLHAHHHKKASLEFNELRSSPESPAHPYGYSIMILIALWPWLWRRTMDPILNRYLDAS
jgi:alkane 1-monooxygenase